MDEQPDPAAVFACAKSLHDACLEREEAPAELSLSEAYQGMDVFMRVVMRVAEDFEKWACRHVAFQELEDVWPYLLDERFGEVCLEIMEPQSLAGFDADDCLRLAFKLRLPMRVDGSLPLPVCVEVPNPVAGAGYRRLRIQSVRHDWGDDGETAAFTEDDEPFDEDHSAPVFGIFGVTDEAVEPIAERKSYAEARAVVTKLLPGIDLPEVPIAFTRPFPAIGEAKEAGREGTGCPL